LGGYDEDLALRSFHSVCQRLRDPERPLDLAGRDDLWRLLATRTISRALELDPKDPALNNTLAWFLATSPEPRLRDAALAVRLAKKAVAARPLSGNYRNTLGVAHYRNGEDRAAVVELKTAMDLKSGGDSSDWFFLALAHQRSGERGEARAWFDRAVRWMDRHKPIDDELRRFRAEAEAMLGEAGKR
jgi:Flp pilus assembly protein TadD